MTSKKERDQEGLYVVEGEHLVYEALKENVVSELIISNNKYDLFTFDNKVYVTDDIMKKICDTVTPQGIIALCKQKQLKELKRYDRILLLDNIQDPGNLGTIIRSCVAFNFDGIVMGLNTVDVYNPKVVRSTQGAIFKVDLIKANLVDYIDYLKSMGVSIFGTSLDGTVLSNIKSQEKMAFIMGNEGNGVSIDLLSITDQNVLIEISEKSESLNVAVASSIIMYNFRKYLE
jgi:TrmH family RNA methyltransferase